MSGPTRRRRVAIGLAVGGLATAGAVALTGAGDDERPVPPPAAAEPTTAAPRSEDGGLRLELSELPERLLADVRALQELPAGERLAAVEDLRSDALAGDYGPQVQTGLDRVGDGVAAVTDRLPPEVRELAERDHSDTVATLESVRHDALEGEYGGQVQGWAEKVAGVFG